MWIPFFTTRKNVAARSIPAPPIPQPRTPVEAVLDYHELTKHHYYRFARSLGYLDWDNQPNPFRRFEGAPFHRLPLLPPDDSPSYTDLFENAAALPQPVTLETLSRLFRHSLAISAWKSHEGSRWALRVNPSSGNLHPTEAYVILNTLESGELPAGVYHYVSEEHGLECRATFPPVIFTELTQEFPRGTFLIGFTSIHWREAWKYGERAYRYCQHDLGHAIAAMRFSARMLGWQMVLVEEPADQDIAMLLGLNRDGDFHEAEDEVPHLVAAMIPFAEAMPAEAKLSEEAINAIALAAWRGHANRLSESHVEWTMIDEVVHHTAKTRTQVNYQAPVAAQRLLSIASHLPASTIIQQRRSAVALDGKTFISSEVFYHILSRTLPDLNPVPFDAFSRSVLSRPRIHLALFVIRVNGLLPGCYVLVRDPQKLQALGSAMSTRFEWSRPPDCPDGVPLYRLETAAVGRLAAGVSCGQEIAGNGVFTLGMMAEFEEPLRTVGAWLYPRLFWEAGLIGHILYLEAEAARIRATGIGCFFDDPMHEVFGLRDKQFQSLYHFTMGGPVEDDRLTTDPPYHESLDRVTRPKVLNPDLP